jgi:hypothetical protein
MPSGVTHTPPLSFCSLRCHLILVLEFYSGLSGRVRSVYLSSLCVVSLLSSRFTASALVWFSNFLKYLVFHSFISLSTMLILRSSWILWLYMHEGAFGMDRRILDWKRWRVSLLELEAAPHRSIWVSVLLSVGEVCFLSIVLNFRVASAFVSLFGWELFKSFRITFFFNFVVRYSRN